VIPAGRVPGDLPLLIPFAGLGVGQTFRASRPAVGADGVGTRAIATSRVEHQCQFAARMRPSQHGHGVHGVFEGEGAGQRN